jgi:hypothetical protein
MGASLPPLKTISRSASNRIAGLLLSESEIFSTCVERVAQVTGQVIKISYSRPLISSVACVCADGFAARAEVDPHHQMASSAHRRPHSH